MKHLSGDSLSTTGYVFTIGGRAISWKYKKQQIIAKSTRETELIALSLANEETGWLRDLLSEIPMWEKLISPVLIHCDKTATIGRVQCAINTIMVKLDLLEENKIL